MTQIASSHNQPAFKDIWGHLRSFVKCGYYSIVSCTQIRVSHFKILTPICIVRILIFSEKWIFLRKWIISENGLFQKIWIFFQRQKIFVQFRFPIIRISTLWNSGIISVSAQPITVSRCAWPITNYFRSTCLSQDTLPTGFQFDSLLKNIMIMSHNWWLRLIAFRDLNDSSPRSPYWFVSKLFFQKLGEKKSVFTIND